MNTVNLIGNLATDVELKDVGEDKKVAGFLLAVNRGSRDGGADFVWVQAWERQAELCAEYLSKGQQVGVAGRLRSRSWEEDGRRRTVVEVVGHRIDFLSAPRESSGGGEVIPFEAAAGL